MQWLLQNWQTMAALGVVGMTAGLFLRRLLRRDRTTCGGDCECPARKGAPRPGVHRPRGEAPPPPPRVT